MKTLFARLALWFLKNAKYTDEKTRNEILTEAVKHLFNTVSSEDVLKENGDGTLTFEGKLLDHSRKKDLIEQAALFDSLILWKVLHKDIQYQINRKLYLESNLTTDMLWGKLITWYHDIVRTRIDRLKRMK